MGGTISAHGKNRLDLKDYTSGKYTGEDFLKNIPELQHMEEISYDSFLNVCSTAIYGEHWFQLGNKVTTYLCEDGFDGIVITHGTNTLEETAYFLHLTVPSSKPIVLVGAQRPFTALSTDAHRNLLNAIRVATDESAHNK